MDSFSLADEITKLENSPRRDLNIIAFYFRRKKPNLENKEQYKVAIKRHLRAAKSLTPFYDRQLAKAATDAESKYPEWTLETLIKLLTK